MFYQSYKITNIGLSLRAKLHLLKNLLKVEFEKQKN